MSKNSHTVKQVSIIGLDDSSPGTISSSSIYNKNNEKKVIHSLSGSRNNESGFNVTGRMLIHKKSNSNSYSNNDNENNKTPEIDDVTYTYQNPPNIESFSHTNSEDLKYSQLSKDKLQVVKSNEINTFTKTTDELSINQLNYDYSRSPKIKIMQDNYEEYIKQEEEASSEYWKKIALSLIEDSMQYEKTILTLFEENRIHQEYIISLEEKLSKLLIKTNNITTNYHQHLTSLHKLIKHMEEIEDKDDKEENEDLNRKNTQITVLKNTIEDYKSQLNILAEEKDSLTANLSLARHQCLQSSIKMEEIQRSSLTFKENWMKLKY